MPPPAQKGRIARAKPALESCNVCCACMLPARTARRPPLPYVHPPVLSNHPRPSPHPGTAVAIAWNPSRWVGSGIGEIAGVFAFLEGRWYCWGSWEGNRREGGYSSGLRGHDHYLCVRRGRPHSIDPGRDSRGSVLQVPSVLHGKAEARGHGRPRRAVPAQVQAAAHGLAIVVAGRRATRDCPAARRSGSPWRGPARRAA